jgi:hypothetical protein
MKLDAWDKSEYTEERGVILPVTYIKQRPRIYGVRKTLATKTKYHTERNECYRFPLFPLAVDGLLGYKTALAIARVFGESYVPITLEQKNLSNNYTNNENSKHY